MVDLVELAILGLILGSFYVLIAIGVSLIFGVQNVINFAHGEFVMLGAYFTFFGWSLFNLNPLVSLIASIPLLLLIGAGIQQILLEPIVGEDELTSLILTFGLALTIRNLARLTFSAETRSINFLSESTTLLGTTLSLNRVLSLLIAVFAGVGFFVFLRYTDWGKAIRATSQNKNVAKACGIDTEKVRLVTFGIGTVLAGIAGGIAGMLFTIGPTMGLDYLLKAFVIVIVGGLGSLVGSVLAGFGYGFVEVSTTLLASSNVALLITYFLLILVLLVRPQGLLGREDT
jgi:branched-chain amino acid transport system permease protein